ncbi:Methionine aminopeptidase 2 [Friedmanniomyces endolithicus]|uniref:Methionine aminopeptidase 2 n=1 Tax=Rachicladosporium monterosium TaxID=1507873 RepID=A0ABR0KY86_9PEZI|nr:Methionine aminopeptidase 2 [Friedmanniomyces endolithicus]KAK5139510.1 Methionine aminopeptidase 2 [Rachicladosporium monterosium]
MTAVSHEDDMADTKPNGAGKAPQSNGATSTNGTTAELEPGDSDDDEADEADTKPNEAGGDGEAKKKKKRKPRKKKKAGAGSTANGTPGGGAKAQSAPPRTLVSQLFPDNSYPIGEEVDYQGSNAYRTTSEEKRHLDRMNSDFLSEYRQAAEVHREAVVNSL